jgi:hypothetical protein
MKPMNGKTARRLIAVCTVGLILNLAQMALSAQDTGSQAKPAADDLSVKGNLFLPNFNVHPGGTLDWGGNVELFFWGAGEGFGLKPTKEGWIRAQPGGNIILRPKGDYKRCAMDFFPTDENLPDVDAIAEITLHIRSPSDKRQEQISFLVLHRPWDLTANPQRSDRKVEARICKWL